MVCVSQRSRAYVDVLRIHLVAARQTDQAATDAQRVRQRRSLRRGQDVG